MGSLGALKVTPATCGSEKLLNLEPFRTGTPTGFASPKDIKNSYDRARLICRYHGLTHQDILTLSPKFWQFHLDDIHAESNNSLVVLTTHLNLCIGTLAEYLPDRPDLEPILEKLLNFDINGQFLLTEVGWGVDASNLETTATMQPDGSFELHTPHQQAAKFMSPTTPDAGMPSGGIVFAKLIVDEEDRGVRPFWALLHDSKNMEKGVTSFALPKRAGAQANDHAVTMFHHKRLPKEALLGSLDKPADSHTHFSEIIERASVGTLSLSTVNVPCLKLSAYSAGKYSLRRKVIGPDGKQIPIFQYRTQQRPILHALAQATVWEAAAKHAADLFVASKDATVKSTTAIAFKVALQGQAQDTLTQLADRCGAQGLYEHNTIIRAQNLMRGNSLAEGELVVISIRLVTELLLNHATLPTSPYPSALLPRYAAGLLAEARAILADLPAGTRDVRDAAFNAAILPLCQPLAEAVGYQLAFDGAKAHGVPADLLAVFEAGVVLRGASWFVENAGWTRREVLRREEEALTALAARFEDVLEGLGVEAFARAPLLTEEAWEGFVGRLPRFGEGEGEDEEGGRG